MDKLCIELKPFFTTISKELTLYEVESINEDLIKEIYQEIVKKTIDIEWANIIPLNGYQN